MRLPRRREPVPATPAADRFPDGDELAPSIPLTWGDLSDIWAALCLYPTDSSHPARRAIENAFVATFGEPLTLDNIMGMYDREPNFEDAFTEGDRFVLTGLQFVGSISTSKGPAKKVLVTLCTRESYPKQITYSALGEGFAALAQRATPADFPHVAEYVRVRLASGNAVKRFVPVPDVTPKAFIDGDDGPAVQIDHADAPAGDGAPPTGGDSVSF